MTRKAKSQLARWVSTPPAFNVPMSQHTTLRVGGLADALVYVKTLSELRSLVQFCRERDIPLFILGEGSNLIVRDGGIRGVVLRLGGELEQVNLNTTKVTVGGGVYLPHLIVQAARKGLSGLERCTGVPGTVGGALISNAGTADEFIGDLVQSVTVLTEEGEVRELSRDELRFGYRWSNLREKGLIIVGAALNLQPDEPSVIMERIHHRWRYRRQTQPVNQPCAGCIFKNPPGERAGRLLEAAGLKGVRIGDAQVSPLHANFIVNLGKATANDVLTLAEHMRQTVHERFRILLEYEVQIVGDD
jgi:UDP-N-acetylmuramate dehydrogenase